jgi:plasmid stabilization system protein ParE
VFKVIVSPRAWDDFFQIHDYIAAEDQAAAARFCEGLLNHIELLGTFPHIGATSGKVHGVRSVLHTPFASTIESMSGGRRSRLSIFGTQPAKALAGCETGPL